MQLSSRTIIATLLLTSCTLMAQEVSRLSTLSFRLSGLGGMMMKDDKVDPWIDRPLAGAEFAVEFQPTGKWKCLQEWNNTSVGVGMTFRNLGNDKMLGNAIAIHGHLNTPFYRSKHFVIGLRPTVGVAICTKNYENTFPDGKEHLYEYVKKDGKAIANWSIGSYLNAYLGMEIFLDFPIKRGFDITAAFGWHHISNGSIQHPNSGYNMFLASLGLRYQPGLDEEWLKAKDSRLPYERPEKQRPKVLSEVEKKWDVEISASGGIKQNYYRDNYPNKQFWGAASIKIAAHWIPVSIFKIGGGIDAFYDGYYACVNEEFAAANPGASVTHFGKTYLTKSEVKNCFRVGFSLQPEFIIGNLTAGIHIGVYLWDPIKNLEYKKDIVEKRNGQPYDLGLFYAYDFSKASNEKDGWCYMQFMLKYRVLKHMFVQLGLKTHGVRAEFIDAGLGVCF